VDAGTQTAVSFWWNAAPLQINLQQNYGMEHLGQVIQQDLELLEINGVECGTQTAGLALVMATSVTKVFQKNGQDLNYKLKQ
jgi:hypothetical protein